MEDKVEEQIKRTYGRRFREKKTFRKQRLLNVMPSFRPILKMSLFFCFITIFLRFPNLRGCSRSMHNLSVTHSNSIAAALYCPLNVLSSYEIKILLFYFLSFSTCLLFPMLDEPMTKRTFLLALTSPEFCSFLRI